jgi:hypothetical protein
MYNALGFIPSMEGRKKGRVLEIRKEGKKEGRKEGREKGREGRRKEEREKC